MTYLRLSNGLNPSRYNRNYNQEIFNSFFNVDYKQMANAKRNTPSVNIMENEDNFVLQMATPGIKKEDIKLELDNDILIVSSEKKENTESKDTYSRREIFLEGFKRSFTLPDTVEGENIKASYEDGILELSIPKKEEAKPKEKVEIAIA